jgi:aminoglycoside 6'-N-acetyltransferase I
MTVTIVVFAGLTPAHCAAAARVLKQALAHTHAGYQGVGEAQAEVALRHADPEWLGYAALDGDRLVGWIGAIRSYSHAWELHPLAVDPDSQRQGVGSALLAALEARAVAEGVLTIYLGSDDDYGGTTLFGRDLYPDVLGHAATVEVTGRGHAIGFYRRRGYQVVGLLPDANGPGRPDIFLAKRLAEPPQG